MVCIGEPCLRVAADTLTIIRVLLRKASRDLFAKHGLPEVLEW